MCTSAGTIHDVRQLAEYTEKIMDT